MDVATPSEPIIESTTVRVVPRPATGKTFVARARVAFAKWERFGERAAEAGTDRSKLINEFIDWFLREPGARLPTRPARPKKDEPSE